jgi:hypothetical protein
MAIFIDFIGLLAPTSITLAWRNEEKNRNM